MFRISLFIFLSKRKAHYKQDFIEYTFQIKISGLSIGSFIEILKMYVLSALNNCARAQIAWKQLTPLNYLNLYEFITQFHDYYKVPTTAICLFYCHKFVKKKLHKSICVKKSNLKFCTVTSSKNTHQIPRD